MTCELSILAENTSVGEKIRFFRHSKMFSCEHLGKSVDLSGTTIHNYETGVLSPSLTMLKKIAFVFGIEPDKLYDDYYKFLDYPFSERIKLIREEHSLSQRELARVFRTSQTAIGSWEREETVPTRKSWERFRELKLL